MTNVIEKITLCSRMIMMIMDLLRRSYISGILTLSNIPYSGKNRMLVSSFPRKINRGTFLWRRHKMDITAPKAK